MTSRRPTYASVRDRWRKRDGSPTAENGSGRRWVVEYYEPGKARVTRESFAVKAAADHRAAELNRQIADGAGPVGLRGDLTVAQWVEQWLAASGGRRNTRYGRESIMRLHVIPVLGEIRLANLEQRDVVELVGSWVAKRSTKNARLIVLNACLSAAVDDRRMTSNPGAGVKLSADAITPKRPRLTDDEAQQILDGVPERFKLIIRLGLVTGMRVSELCGLTHEQITYLANGEAVITVDRQLGARHGGRTELFAPTKYPAHSDRDVKIDRETAAMIVAYENAYGRGPQGAVFVGGSRSPIFTQSSANSLMARHVRPILGDERYLAVGSWHAFRRYHASKLRDAGRPSASAAARLGHSVAVLERSYNLSWNETETVDLDAITASLSPARARHLTVVGSAESA